MSKVSNLIGILTIFFVSLTITSIIFPSLFSSIFGKFSTNLVPYEIGFLGIPILISNIILLLFGFFYYKKKLPPTISQFINHIRCFEISTKYSTIALIIILAIYIGFSIPELFLDESEQWGDYVILQDALEIWPGGVSENIYVEEQNDRYVRMFLLDLSQNLFQNIKILPFLASIFTIIITYFLTVQITQKRFAGIISILILLQSYTFLKYDTIAVYENFWVLFYLLSIFFIRKQWILSPIFYILSVFTKAFVAPYFIMTLFFTARSQISSKKKFCIFISYVLIISLASIVIFAGDTIYPNVLQIEPYKFFIGIATFGPLMRYDLLLLMTIFPVVVGLTLLAKNQSKEVDSILFLIMGTLIAGPMLIVFTNFYEILPYRFIPLIIFFAIGSSMFFLKKN